MVTQGSHKGLVGRSRWKTSIFGTVILLALQALPALAADSSNFDFPVRPAMESQPISEETSGLRVVAPEDREDYEKEFYFPEDEPVTVDGQKGQTQQDLEQTRELLERVVEDSQPQSELVQGSMWSDRYGVPLDVDRQRADYAEVTVAEESSQVDSLARAAYRCESFWPTGIEVCGATLDQYERLGGLTSWLLYPTEVKKQNPDGRGFRQQFVNGWIYWSPEHGAHAVSRMTAAVWARNGWEAGWLGYPTSGENPVNGATALDGEVSGWMQQFEGGRIYRSPALQGFQVASINGLILDKWLAEGGTNSTLGFPVADEAMTPDRVGRFSRFQGGSIYWHPRFGAHSVEGEILKKWGAAGFEVGEYGYPIAVAVVEEGTLQATQQFENGIIRGKVFDGSDGYVTPYIYFPSPADAEEYFRSIENSILQNGYGSVPAVAERAAITKEYGPCVLEPQYIHRRTKSGATGEDKIVGFKAYTKCSKRVTRIDHSLSLHAHQWFPLPMGSFVKLAEFENHSLSEASLKSEALAYKCDGDKKTIFGGSVAGTIDVSGKKYYARAYPPNTRLECGIK
ncbi:hypothetical protein NQ023_01555 [Corynebacterium phoceense]|uniref:LGFP repeat-containing protein n=1 Tax=Corynebacterium phoceense TaxID=1686286 RepID=UPI00211CB7D6|nr:hypothetical protein [Corynebacterium phoceense]MCQ9347160.1 hypothetical protein [Corynebacterium phoceense]